MPSTAIRHIEYDAEQRELTVTFVTGRVYRYDRVPQEVYDGLVTAASKGAFFNRRVRGSYPYDEVTPKRAEARHLRGSGKDSRPRHAGRSA